VGDILGKRAVLLYTIRCMWILGRICFCTPGNAVVTESSKECL
jgi:hypothetical protein